MKIAFKEGDGSFFFDLTAETVADAALIVRLSLNATQKVQIYGAANKDGSVYGSVVVRKGRKGKSYVRCG